MHEQFHCCYYTDSGNGGVYGFDDLFYGGIRWPGKRPVRILISGSPGSGKSTLALQLACKGRAESRPTRDSAAKRTVLYYILDDVRPRIEEKVIGFDLGEALSKVYLCSEAALQGELCSQESRGDTALYLIDRCGKQDILELDTIIASDITGLSPSSNAEQVEFAVVVDSISTLELNLSPAKLNILGAAYSDKPFDDNKLYPPLGPSSLFLVAEQNDKSGRDPYLTDVFISLWQTVGSGASGEYCERYLQVVKAANCPHVRGWQAFRINSGTGIEVLLSLPANAGMIKRFIADFPRDDKKKRRFGIDSLDRCLCSIEKAISSSKREQRQFLSEIATDHSREDGAIAEGSSTLLVGPTGSHKAPMALHFCAEAVRNGKGKALYLSLHDRTAVIEQFVRTMDLDLEETPLFNKLDGFNIDESEAKGNFIVMHLGPEFIPPEAFLSRLKRLLATMNMIPGLKGYEAGDHRLVIAAMSDLSSTFPRIGGNAAFFSLLLNTLYAYGITSLLLFNNGRGETEEEKTLAHLAGNVFRLMKRPVEKKMMTLLQVEELGNRISGIDHVFQVQRGNRVQVDSCAEKYYWDKSGNFLPAPVKLFVNKTADVHHEFNRAVCSACDVDLNDLNETLAQERGESYEKMLLRVKGLTDCAAIMALDLAYLKDSLLQNFMPISIDEGAELEFVPLGKDIGEPLKLCKVTVEGKSTIRVLPSFVDCTIVLCNLRILRGATRSQSEHLRLIDDRIREALKKNPNEWQQGIEPIPLIDVPLFVNAADDFSSNAKPGVYFFGFPEDSDPEIVTCMFLEWLQTSGVVKRGSIFLSRDNKDKWMETLLAFADLYLPRHARSEGKRVPSNCLFYHNWHSMLYSQDLVDMCPVRIGTEWKATQGGWCWGIVNNEMGGERAKKVLEYATNREMSAYRINHRIGIPPRSTFCMNNGDISIYNLHLMREVFQNGWSRTSMANYLKITPFLHSFFPEFIASLNRMGHMSEPHKEQVVRWLRESLKDLQDKTESVEGELKPKRGQLQSH